LYITPETNFVIHDIRSVFSLGDKYIVAVTDYTIRIYFRSDYVQEILHTFNTKRGYTYRVTQLGEDIIIKKSCKIKYTKDGDSDYGIK